VSKIKKWRKIEVIETCPECGQWILKTHNDSNIEAWAECECGVDTPLRFSEAYITGVHGHMKQWADNREEVYL